MRPEPRMTPYSLPIARDERVSALRAHLRALQLDGVVIPRFDAYQGEVVAEHDARLAYVTGFAGSAGIALVTQDDAVIFVDGRYQIQVRQEVNTNQFEIAHFFDAPIEQWLAANGTAGMRVGVNTGLVPNSLYERLETAMATCGGRLVPLLDDAVDAIWPDQPAPPLAPVTVFPLDHAGEDSPAKRQRIAAKLRDMGADLMVETQPDNVAWLLNIRGGDVPMLPVAHSTLLLDAQGNVEWFIDARKLPNDRAGLDAPGLTLAGPDDLLARLSARAGKAVVAIDPAFAPVAVRQAVEGVGGKPVFGFSPITLTKAVKNDVELDGFRQVHVADGVAMVEFLAWLAETAPLRLAAGNPITEIEAQTRLRAFRAEQPGFVDESFAPISAAGSNAAMCHYNAKPESNAPITAELPYLIDSGGQYFGGTTDVTRTVMLGTPDAAVRQTYTAVLSGFIALMTAQFPLGTCGHHLDALARRPLWDLGLDYDHGTGHGVGHFLSVHEHPHRFGKVVNAHPFAPGNVMTIEPGYYREDGFGLRVENQVEVVAAAPGFLRFETLTLVPIDLGMVNRDELTRAEVRFLDQYHAQVRAALSGRLTPRAQSWLDSATAPVFPAG